MPMSAIADPTSSRGHKTIPSEQHRQSATASASGRLPLLVPELGEVPALWEEPSAQSAAVQRLVECVWFYVFKSHSSLTPGMVITGNLNVIK